MEQQSLEISFRRDTNVSEFGKENLNEASQVELIKRNLIFRTAALGQRNKRQKKTNLREILKKAKVKVLTKNFTKKLRRNSIYRPVADYLSSSQQQDSISLNTWQEKLAKLGETNGVILNNLALAIWSFGNIIQITAMVFIFSAMLTFPQTQQNQIFLYFRISSIVLYIVDMIFNFITQRYQSGKKLETLGQISHFYLRNGFLIDLVSILIFPIDLFVNSNVTMFISFVAIIKLINNVNKFQKFEYLYINTSQKQQYFGLIKVFLTNFAIGHFLSIILNLMTLMNPSENWVTHLGIDHQLWYVKYIWGYYWGTNIMLTVGFGDISATNYYQAIILIFIQTFSCITLAYNISYVGALIGSISQKNACKKKKMKTLHRMCKQNEVSSEIQTKLSNFVEQFYRIKQTFSYDDEDEVLQFLPKSMQLEYRKQSNKILFDNLGFLSNMSKKTLLKLAESVSRKICHPEEIIIKKGNISDFIILQKGQIGMACKIRSKLDGRIIETINVEDSSKPRIFSLDFIKNKICQFNLKSLKYSVLYCLSRQDFMNSLKGSEMDFQLFCVLRDRDGFILDENNLYECQICKTQFHNKFECPRLHFLPLRQSVIYKSLQSNKKKKQPRIPQHRYSVKFQVFRSYPQVKKDQKSFIKANFDEQQFTKMENLINFYQNLPKSFKKLPMTALQLPPKSNNDEGTRTKVPVKIINPKIGDDKTIQLLEQLLSNTKQSSFWDVECDEANNFRYYFQNSNPSNLSKSKKVKKFSRFLFSEEGLS